MTVFVSLSLLDTIRVAASPLTRSDRPTIRIIVMPYKIMGDIDNTKPKQEQVDRLASADRWLRQGLEQTGQYDLIDETASREFAKQVTTLLSNNACKHCESVLAKELKAKQIVVPWVYRLSQLVLTMHVVVLDAETGSPLLKKSLDFRGDNDKSWERAIRVFCKSLPVSN